MTRATRFFARPGFACAERAANTRRAVAASMLVEHFRDLGRRNLVVDSPCARLSMQPLIVAAARDAEHSTGAGDRDVCPLRVNEFIHDYFTSFANRAAAFLAEVLRLHFTQLATQPL